MGEKKDSNAVAGFGATGLFPLDRKAIKHKIVPSAMDVEELAATYPLARTEAEMALCNTLSNIVKEVVSGSAVQGQGAGPSGQAPKKPRARVQAKEGEVLTSKESMSRIQADEQAKIQKEADRIERKRIRDESIALRKKLRVEKAEAVAARKLEQAAKKSVQIQMRLSKSQKTSAKGLTKGSKTMPEYFAAMRKAAAEGDTASDGPLEVSVPRDDNRTVQDDLAQQPEVHPRRSATKKDAGFYEEGDSTLDSDGDEDQPRKFTTDDFVIGEYVIFTAEEAFFPGQVCRIRHKTCYVSVKAMAKHENPDPSFWWWPENRMFLIKVTDILKKIKPPVLKAFGAPFVYQVDEIAEYWTAS